MSIDDKFRDLDRRNPHIFETLKGQGLRWKARGAKRISIKALWEFARMTHWLDSVSGEPWKLNNDYTSRYARKLMTEVPELRGMFETREIGGPLIHVEARSKEQEDILAIFGPEFCV